MVSTWSHAATGRLAYNSAETTSQMIISGPQASRSTQAPAGRPRTSQGRYAAAVSAATARVEACKTSAASSGIPTTAIAFPVALIDSPIHSNRKFRCRSTPPNR